MFTARYELNNLCQFASFKGLKLCENCDLMF